MTKKSTLRMNQIILHYEKYVPMFGKKVVTTSEILDDNSYSVLFVINQSNEWGDKENYYISIKHTGGIINADVSFYPRLGLGYNKNITRQVRGI